MLEVYNLQYPERLKNSQESSMNVIFGKFSRWSELTKKYATRAKPIGQKHIMQTIKVGAVRWRFCVTAVFSQQGIYLQIGARPSIIFGKLQPVLIPWSEFKNPRRGWLYLGWQAVELSVGEPEIGVITFPLNFYHKMQEYAAQSARQNLPNFQY
jgi:hypothetical protein